MLDGSWGVLLQREVRGEEALPRRAVPRPPARRRRRPRPAQPDAAGRRSRASTTSTSRPAPTSRRRTRSRRRRSARPTTASSDAVVRDERRGRAARAAAATSGRRRRRPRFVAGSVGPLNVTLSLSPRGRRPGVPRRHLRRGARGVRASRSAALRDGGVDLLLIETIFDTLNAKAAIAAARDVAPRAAALDLGHRSSTGAAATLSGQTVEAFWISVEHAEPLIVGVNCSLGAARDAPVRRGPRARSRRRCVALLPERRPAERVRRLRRDSRDDTSRCLGEFARDGLVNIVGGCCGTTPEHIRAIAAAVDGRRAARASPQRRAGARASAASSRSRSRPDTGFVMIGERTNVTGSARFRRLIEAGDFAGGGRRRARAGARRRQPARREHGRRPARRRGGDDDVPEPRSRPSPRSRGCRSWSTARAGRCSRPACKCVQGKGDRQLDQPQGGRGGRSSRRRARVRDYGAGVVVMAFDEEGQADDRRAQGRDLRARLRPARRARSASRPRTSSSTRTSSPSRPASRSTTTTRRRSSRRCR